MGIFRTNDPTQFDDIDGIIIDEQTPPSQITGVSANVAILIGQFQRGTAELSGLIASIGEFQERYGRSSYLGNIQLRNKAFGRLRIIRVIAADAVTASLAIDGKLMVSALSPGAYGSNLSVEVKAGDESGFCLVVRDNNPLAVLPVERYDNLEIADITPATFANSNLVKVEVLDNQAGNPALLPQTALDNGSDGTIADTDYEAALVKAEVERSANVVFLDEYNTVRNQLLKIHAGLTTDKMVVCAGAVDDDRAEAIAEAETLRDATGRIIYAWPYVETLIDGVRQYTSPAAWLVSIFTQVAPHIALSFTANTRFLGGVTGLRFTTSRNGHIELDEGGVAAFENDSDIGFVLKNAVVTHRANTQLREIIRRRMTDFLTDSIALALKNYQNDVNSQDRRDEVQSLILDFDARLVRDGILPGQQDVNDGAPLLVDTESPNTDAIIAAGQFRILYRRRIFSSMRYIVLQAEVGTGVLVTEV